MDFALESKVKKYGKVLEHLSAKPNSIIQQMIVLRKLYNMDIGFHILQVTGIGKIVNRLRHDKPPVGIFVKTLIEKWKNQVICETEADSSSNSAQSPSKIIRTDASVPVVEESAVSIEADITPPDHDENVEDEVKVDDPTEPPVEVESASTQENPTVVPANSNAAPFGFVPLRKLKIRLKSATTNETASSVIESQSAENEIVDEASTASKSEESIPRRSQNDAAKPTVIAKPKPIRYSEPNLESLDAKMFPSQPTRKRKVQLYEFGKVPALPKVADDISSPLLKKVNIPEIRYDLDNTQDKRKIVYASASTPVFRTTEQLDDRLLDTEDVPLKKKLKKKKRQKKAKTTLPDDHQPHYSHYVKDWLDKNEEFQNDDLPDMDLESIEASSNSLPLSSEKSSLVVEKEVTKGAQAKSSLSGKSEERNSSGLADKDAKSDRSLSGKVEERTILDATDKEGLDKEEKPTRSLSDKSDDRAAQDRPETALDLEVDETLQLPEISTLEQTEPELSPQVDIYRTEQRVTPPSPVQQISSGNEIVFKDEVDKIESTESEPLKWDPEIQKRSVSVPPLVANKSPSLTSPPQQKSDGKQRISLQAYLANRKQRPESKPRSSNSTSNPAFILGKTDTDTTLDESNLADLTDAAQTLEKLNKISSIINKGESALPDSESKLSPFMFGNSEKAKSLAKSDRPPSSAAASSQSQESGENSAKPSRKELRDKMKREIAHNAAHPPEKLDSFVEALQHSANVHLVDRLGVSRREKPGPKCSKMKKRPSAHPPKTEPKVVPQTDVPSTRTQSELTVPFGKQRLKTPSPLAIEHSSKLPETTPHHRREPRLDESQDERRRRHQEERRRAHEKRKRIHAALQRESDITYAAEVQQSPMPSTTYRPSSSSRERHHKAKPSSQRRPVAPYTSGTGDEMMKTVYSKTKVFAGRSKKQSGIPKLFELCMRVLVHNIDSIEYVGGIPAHVLFPLLRRCSASQLFTLEHFNQHFVGETDYLWEQHYKRDFKKREQDGDRSWRDMYIEEHGKREEKFNKVTSLISNHVRINKKGQRSTKLAFANCDPKAPRGVRRKADLGTSALPAVTPKHRREEGHHKSKPPPSKSGASKKSRDPFVLLPESIAKAKSRLQARMKTPVLRTSLS